MLSQLDKKSYLFSCFNVATFSNFNVKCLFTLTKTCYSLRVYIIRLWYYNSFRGYYWKRKRAFKVLDNPLLRDALILITFFNPSSVRWVFLDTKSTIFLNNLKSANFWVSFKVWYNYILYVMEATHIIIN